MIPEEPAFVNDIAADVSADAGEVAEAEQSRPNPDPCVESPLDSTSAQDTQIFQTGTGLTPSELESQFEEPLALASEDGAGYFPGQPGMLLHDGEYEIILKLGWGEKSSTWLVEHKGEETLYAAIKILTSFATQDHHKKDARRYELECLQRIRDEVRPNSVVLEDLPSLYDHFETYGPHGSHLCLVLPVLTTSVESFRLSSPLERFPLFLVKQISLHVLCVMSRLDEMHILHTGICAKHVFFVRPSGVYIIDFVEDTEPDVLDKIVIDGAKYPVMRSQPFQHDYEWNDGLFYTLENYRYCVIGFGSAGFTDCDTYKESLRAKIKLSLCPPEVILGGEISTKVDVWMFGCMIYELLTGHQLFQTQGGNEVTAEQELLAEMVALTGQNFDDDFLTTCTRRAEFFTPTGSLIHSLEPCPPPTNIRNMIASFKFRHLSEEEIDDTAAIIQSCLIVDPSKRVSAEALFSLTWCVSQTGKEDLIFDYSGKEKAT